MKAVGGDRRDDQCSVDKTKSQLKNIWEWGGDKAHVIPKRVAILKEKHTLEQQEVSREQDHPDSKIFLWRCEFEIKET